MAAVCIVKKCPDLVEDFMPKITTLMEDRSHGVLIATVTLVTEILRLDSTFL
jgi:AP-1 complex subunit gamma-1